MRPGDEANITLISFLFQPFIFNAAGDETRFDLVACMGLYLGAYCNYPKSNLNLEDLIPPVSTRAQHDEHSRHHTLNDLVLLSHRP